MAATLATLGGGLLAFATLAGFLLHLAGHVAHTTHLTSVGVPAQLFVKTADLRIIDGYYAVVLQGLSGFGDTPWLKLLAMWALATVAVLIARLPSKNGNLITWLATRPRRRELVVAMAGSALAILVLLYALLLTLLIAVVPGFIGERYGKQLAEQTRASFKSGVSTTEVWRGETRISHGVLIAASPAFIALYESESKRIRTLDRDGMELRTNLPPITNATK